jgi:stearoyl-CoA desaturase (delta-9 desaturase)
MGESWHNNHHAFPASARHGIFPGQLDIGFRFVKALEALGLAWNVQTPESLPPRNGISPLTRDAASLLTTIRGQVAAK